MSDLLPAMAEARQRFMELVAEVRPALHRYCARMTGSVFDGEDVVQDTLAKAYYALAEMESPPKLEPWLFRIAHNTAMDFVRRYEHRNVELMSEPPEQAQSEEPGADGTRVEAALAVFVALPPTQRSALALVDVLGHSLDQTATTMGTTVSAVKAALARARAHVATAHAQPPQEPVSAEDQQSLRRYADLFNARNWDGLRALFGEESRLDLVSRWQRRGPSASHYFTRYAEITRDQPLRAVPGWVEGRPAIAMFRPGADRPAYFVQVQWDSGRIALIRDFHYVPYIAEAANFNAA